MNEKENYLLYNKKADSNHWNEIGCYFAYRELAKHLGISEEELYKLDDFEITFDMGRNTLEVAFGESNIPTISLINDVTFRMLDDDYFDKNGLDYLHSSHNNHVFVNENDNLPTLLVFRDSYMGYGDLGVIGYPGQSGRSMMKSYLPQHFSETIFVHNVNIEHMQGLVDFFEPDIVLIQTIERELPVFLQRVALFSQE